MPNILLEMINVDKLKKYYDDNIQKPWKEWLTHEKNLRLGGKQGIVGIMKTHDGQEILYKISQQVNHLVDHEYMVMNSLNDLKNYCPHFCKSVGMIKSLVNPSNGIKGDPFDINDCKYPPKKHILLMEYHKNCKKLSTMLENKKISDSVIFSCIKQVLNAINIAQQKKKFTHYDLHSDNILMKKCNKDLVFFYKGSGINRLQPTYGYYPIIIDFGFSYIGDMHDNPLLPSMGHTSVGFCSDRYDNISDVKLLYITLNQEIKCRKKNPTISAFKRDVKTHFKQLKVHWDSGWDNIEEKSVADRVSDAIFSESNRSEFLWSYEHFVFDIVQTLIISPMEKTDYSQIKKAYKSFAKEFRKIEDEITDDFYRLYILKFIVDTARYLRPYYIDGATRKKTILMFRREIYRRLNEISKFCTIKEVNFERLLCSLYLFSECMEGVMYEAMKKNWKKKQQEYDKLELRTVDEYSQQLCDNIPEEYVYHEGTTILVFDTENEYSYPLALTSEDCEFLNGNISHDMRDKYILQICE